MKKNEKPKCPACTEVMAPEIHNSERDVMGDWFCANPDCLLYNVVIWIGKYMSIYEKRVEKIKQKGRQEVIVYLENCLAKVKL